MLSIENTKLLTYGWLICVALIYLIKHLVDSGLIKFYSGFKMSFKLSNLDYEKLLMPLLAIPIIYLLNIKYESDKNKDKEDLRRNAKITIGITAVCIISYYLTRWKIINGPFNYSNYFGSPGREFSPIFKTFRRLNLK
tara:strand:+ start:492 stop:905 length:414 start_codon:yes stop_codon:yes gene_type:complete